jgi:acetolactate synthase-1/2/3 large subunit
MGFGEYLVALLERYGVRHVFGIPGVHTAELYRGLAGSSIRHVTPRHEQGAGFMADGYARMSGRPGVCFVITGPGVTNIATAMAQAYADSIPMLMISGVAATGDLGRGKGNLHELPDQQGLASKLCAFSHTLRRAGNLQEVLARAFALFASAHPRPVHIEIPLDVMGWSVGNPPATIEPLPSPPRPENAGLETAAPLLANAENPLLLVGGGARGARDAVVAFAEQLDAPVVMTVNARGIMPQGHPLAVPASPSLDAVRKLVADADVVLAVGTELGPTDYNMYSRGAFLVPGQLIRVDIDPDQLSRNVEPSLALTGDARVVLRALSEGVSLARRGAAGRRPSQGAARAATARDAAFAELSPAMQRQVQFLHAIRDALPGVVIVGDSTQAVYAGNLYYEPDAPGGWFNSAVGYGTLGYALPAAIGAKLGAPERPVVALAGDGGLQFTLGELGSAIDAGAPIIALVWNNRGYGEIKSYFLERGVPPIGVDLATPDFCAIARAYGWNAERLDHADSLPQVLKQAARSSRPTLVEIVETGTPHSTLARHPDDAAKKSRSALSVSSGRSSAM